MTPRVAIVPGASSGIGWGSPSSRRLNPNGGFHTRALSRRPAQRWSRSSARRARPRMSLERVRAARSCSTSLACPPAQARATAATWASDMARNVDRSAGLRRIARRYASTASWRTARSSTRRARESCTSGTVRGVPSAVATRADTKTGGSRRSRPVKEGLATVVGCPRIASRRSAGRRPRRGSGCRPPPPRQAADPGGARRSRGR
jgi:hypothetical protein